MIPVKIKIASYILLIAMESFILSACNSHKTEVQKNVEKMQSSAIIIPYEQMACWARDSVLKSSPWSNAKLKLVHYVDSTTCSSCYLQKVAINRLIFSLESQSNNDFYNIFVISPNIKAKKRLEADYSEKLIPQTIFGDTANVFMKSNPNVPLESIYHTFLLDESNKVILVGNPVLNKQIEDMMLTIVEAKLARCVKKKR